MSDSTPDLSSLLLAGRGAQRLRLAAAKGLVPMELRDQLRVLIRLTADPDQQVGVHADHTLTAMSDEQLLPLLSDPACPQEILSFFCFALGRSQTLLEAVAKNNSTPDPIVADLALIAEIPILQVILFNQVRLIRYPLILENILENPYADTTIRRQATEIRQEFLTKALIGQPSVEETSAGPTVGILTQEGPPEPPPVPSPEEAGSSETESEPLEVVNGLDPKSLGISQPEEVGVYKQLAVLNTSQRIKRALLGSREERAILIRDTNRMVATMVLKSPKISEQEISVISSMRNVSEEILRLIAENRAWVKNYAIVTNLVKNSKTPMATSLHLLPRLMDRDIRFLAKDRSIADVVRRSAQRILITKGMAN
jgi:hypothetical protein